MSRVRQHSFISLPLPVCSAFTLSLVISLRLIF